MSTLTLDTLRGSLAQHTGSETQYRHAFGPLRYTEGVRDLADRAGAHWLIDLVASYQRRVGPGHWFQLWRVDVRGSAATVTARDDTNMKPFVRQRIPFTDFPEGVFEWYVVDGTMLLKSEY